MPDEIVIPGLEGIDMSNPEDTRPDWFSGEEMTQDDPAFKEIVEQMKAAGMEVPEGLPEPTPLATGKETDELPPTDESTGPIPDEPPADPELPPAYDATDTPPADPDAGEPDPPSEPLSDHIDISLDGQEYQINQEQATYLLQMNSWIESIPQEMKQQWAGIQEGTHVAISQEQLANLQQAAQAPPQPSPNRVNPDDLDDDTAAYIRELEGKVPQQQTAPITQDAPPQPSPQDMAAAATHEANERVRLNGIITETTEAYAKEYGLDQAQVQRLQQVTTELGVVPAIQRRHRVYSPTGQMIRDADFGEVVKEAYGVAMSTDKELSKAHSDHVFETRKAQEAEKNRATNAKKGRAGSLASAPSAAVPAGDNTLQIGANNQMDVQGTANAIAKALAEAAKTP